MDEPRPHKVQKILHLEGKAATSRAEYESTMARITPAVGLLRGFVSIERHADGAIANGMDVDLEAFAVEAREEERGAQQDDAKQRPDDPDTVERMQGSRPSFDRQP